MTEKPDDLVGSEATRSVHGRSAGGTLVVVGPGHNGGGEATDVPRAVAGMFGLMVTGPGPIRTAPLDEVARIARESDGPPLVVVAADVVVSPVALLDVLDAPADRTSAGVVLADTVAERDHAPSPVRISDDRRRIEAVATPTAGIGPANAYPVGVLRIAGRDRREVASALDARRATQGGQTVADPFGDLVATVVGAAVDVVPVDLAHQTVSRGAWCVPGAPGSPWQQRLRAASRGNDGVFSRVAIRPLSRRVTAVGLARDWSPNVVTAVSLAAGLAACAMVALDRPWAWVLAAVLLQASLVLDCVDGEIARFTRRYSPLGGWLDAVSDRVKEFTMVAALAWVGARRGVDLWWLAVLVLAVLAVRHVEDYAYTRRARRRSREPSVGASVGRMPPGAGQVTAPTVVPQPPDRSARTVRAARQVLHLPIAERYLIVSLGLLMAAPAIVLWALGVASALALAWTEGGRLAKALTRRDGFSPERGDTGLRDLVDLGFVPAPAGRGRFDWQVPGLLVAVEAAALLLVSRGHLAAHAAAYAWLAVVCWHTYDNVYRVRETGRGAADWLRRAAGLEVRLLLLLVVGVITGSASGGPQGATATLLVGAGVLLLLYAVESTVGWRAGTAPRDAGDAVPASRARQDGAS